MSLEFRISEYSTVTQVLFLDYLQINKVGMVRFLKLFVNNLQNKLLLQSSVASLLKDSVE